MMARTENKTRGKSGSRPARHLAPPSAASGGYVQRANEGDFRRAARKLGDEREVTLRRPSLPLFAGISRLLLTERNVIKEYHANFTTNSD